MNELEVRASQLVQLAEKLVEIKDQPYKRITRLMDLLYKNLVRINDQNLQIQIQIREAKAMHDCVAFKR